LNTLYFDGEIIVLSSSLGYMVAMYNLQKTLSTVFMMQTLYAPDVGTTTDLGKWFKKTVPTHL
jgi:hypothetical protein